MQSTIGEGRGSARPGSLAPALLAHAKPPPRSFYLQPTLRVARQLLGMFLVRKTRSSIVAGMIVEVEAYLGEHDPASHAYRGLTRRNEVMFEEGGRLYVYFTYGMHYCCNVVTGKRGHGRAVLIRALEPVAGIPSMKRRRRLQSHDQCPTGLTNGPAKLCQALGITGIDNGRDLSAGSIRILHNKQAYRNRGRIMTSTRIGITEGKEHPWRFYLDASRFVSKR